VAAKTQRCFASKANYLRSVTARKKLISANYPIIKRITEEKDDCLCIVYG